MRRAEDRDTRCGIGYLNDAKERGFHRKNALREHGHAVRKLRSVRVRNLARGVKQSMLTG